MLPSPYPRPAFERALQLATDYNQLYEALSQNTDMLLQIGQRCVIAWLDVLYCGLTGMAGSVKLSLS